MFNHVFGVKAGMTYNCYYCIKKLILFDNEIWVK